MLLTNKHAELIEKSKHWAVAHANDIAKKYYPYLSAGDIENVAYDALIKVAEGWDIKSGAWSTYLYSTFNHRAHKEFLKLRWGRRNGRTNTVSPPPDSLNLVIFESDNGDKFEAIDLLTDKTTIQQFGAAEIRATLESALKILPAREQEVVFRYFFLDETLKTIGDRLEVSTEWVRQLKEKALGQLKIILAD